MRHCTSLAAALLIVGVGLSTAHAQSTLYWDITGATPGATNGDGIGDGTWDNIATNWNTDATGGAGGAISAWTNPLDNAVFSAGNDVSTDPLVGGAFITITGTQIANSILIEDGYVKFISGTADTGAGTVTINSGATLDVNSTSRLNTGAGKVVLNGGKLLESNPGQAGSFIGGSTGLKGIEVNGTGTIGYDDADGIASNKVSIYFGVITGVGGTVDNGGAGTLIKVGPDQFGLGVSSQGGVHSHTLMTFAKLVVEEGAYRLRTTTFDNTARETGFGAVPLAELPDAITLNGGGIGTSGTITLHANRGITIGDEGGYFDHGAGASMTIPGPITGSATLSIGSFDHVGTTAPNPTFTLSNTNNASTFTGKLHVLRGTLSVPDAAALGATPGSPVADSITIGGPINLTTVQGGSSTLSFSGSTTLAANRGITLAGTTDGRINIPSGGNTLTYNGVITGPGKFIKMGDGTLSTASAHTYTGGTDVYGRLLVNNTSGSGTGTGAVNVKTTATGLGTDGTLGGTGSVSGLVTVESGGTIAPGLSIGTLTLAGGLTLNAGSLLGIELGAPTMGDLINVGGTTTINGGTVNVADAGGLGAGTYTILDYAGALGGSFSNLALGTTPAGFSFALMDTGSAINLSVSAVAGLLGDYNEDDIVDAADFVVWRKAEQTGVADLPNDNDDPGNIGPAEYALWRANFGSTLPGSGSGLGGGAVPEPASVVLVMLGMAAMAMGRRGR